MRTEIIEQLKNLERRAEIKILYAVESGSRAWGFASRDSDWDVRFVYIHKTDWYLSIDEKKDNLTEILPNDLDLSGWELRKTLKLFRKSNPPLLEWLQSPIVYLEDTPTINHLRELAAEFFNPKACLYHYLHMAEGNYREYLQKDLVRVKKYFYVLRPILACQWIERERTTPPIEFRKLVDSQLENSELKDEIERLLIRKMDGDELNVEPKIAVLNDYLEERISYFNDMTKDSSEHLPPDSEKLDVFFRKILSEHNEIKK